MGVANNQKRLQIKFLNNAYWPYSRNKVHVHMYELIMAYLLSKLQNKKDIDKVIKSTEDKVLVLRFGKEDDPICLQLDDIVSFCTLTIYY